MILPQIPKDELQKRQKSIQTKLNVDEALILFSNETKIRNGDVEYKFRQDSNFWYLTGFNEPDSAVIISAEKIILFCRDKNPLTELWTGKIASFEQAKEITNSHEVFDFKDFQSEMEKNLSAFQNIYFDKTNSSYSNLQNRLESICKKNYKQILPANDLLWPLRIKKSGWEIKQMKIAAEISVNAHQKLFQFLKSNQNKNEEILEYQLEAVLIKEFYFQGGDWSYPAIVAAGNNTTTLHYIQNSSKINPSDLILVDSAAEFNYYSSDITRTYPAGGKFSSEQKEIYNLVLIANQKVIEMAKNHTNNDITLLDLHKEAVKILTLGLIELKILNSSFDEAIEKQNYKKFFPHSIGHWLGLDTHDCGPHLRDKKSRINLQPGMIFTVEPGLYFAKNNQLSPERYKGFGVRIEDDILITEDGIENLTQKLAKESNKLEF